MSARAKVRASAWLLACAVCMGAVDLVRAETYVVIVTGLGGEERYDRDFREAGDAFVEAVSGVVNGSDRLVRLSGEDATREALRARLRALKSRLAPSDDLIVALVGHGSYDGEEYKLNLPGPDVTAQELAALLGALPARRQLVVNATSASGASLEALRSARRTVVTATRSGGERNATVFAQYWVRALRDPSADLDKDGWITAREAFEHTEAAVAKHFARAVQLATEHPRIEEAERVGTFRVARLDASSRAGAMDPRRTELLGAIDALRGRKGELEESAYYEQLEQLLLRLARLQSEREEESTP